MFATIPELAVPEPMVGQLGPVLADGDAAELACRLLGCRARPFVRPEPLPPIYAGNVTAICGSVL